MNKNRRAEFRLLLVFFTLFPFYAWSAEITIALSSDTNCMDGTCDLQSALTFAAGNSESDTITIPSTASLPNGELATATPFNYSGESFDLTIQGAGEGRTALSGGDVSRVLQIEAPGSSAESPINVSLSGMTIRNGNSALNEGAGLRVYTRYGHISLDHIALINNNAQTNDGGGAWLSMHEFGGGSVTVQDSSFIENQGSQGAGLYVNFPDINLSSNTFDSNLMRGSCHGAGAYVDSNNGPVTIANNWFDNNASENEIDNCQGGGLYLRASGFLQSNIDSNQFHGNQLNGNGGAGAGVYVQRIDGPMTLQANIFKENIVGGNSSDTGGGGLWAGTYGSFSDIHLVNNAFVRNSAPTLGYAAWLYSLDPVAFKLQNNSVVWNRPLDIFSDNTAAVLIDAPEVDLYNNLLWPYKTIDQPGTALTIIDQASQTEAVNLQYNVISGFELPAVTDGLVSPNFEHVPILFSHDFHISDRLSSTVDTGFTYPDSPDVDLDNEPRPIDGDADGEAYLDIGADEFGGYALLSPKTALLESRKYAAQLPSNTGRVFQIENTGNSTVEIQNIYLENSMTADWSLDSTPAAGHMLPPGSSEWLQVGYQALSETDSDNKLIVETSINTMTANLKGEFHNSGDHSDRDGIGDDFESGPTGRYTNYDGNCDGASDADQSNVASFNTSTGEYITLVAPTPAQKIGTGPNFALDQTPFFTDIRTLITPDESGGGPRGHGYPYGFLSFQVTTIAGEAGGFFPVSIILPHDAPLVDGYVKDQPVPTALWLRSSAAPEGGTGLYDFVYNSPTHIDLMMRRVGARIETVTQNFPVFGPGETDWTCAPQTRQVIHLHLRDGLLGDSDMVENGTVFDPGGPALMPTLDSDGDTIADYLDNCPTIDNPNQIDSDIDGFGDSCDLCPQDASKIDPGVCGCGVADIDANSNGIMDCVETGGVSYTAQGKGGSGAFSPMSILLLVIALLLTRSHRMRRHMRADLFSLLSICLLLFLTPLSTAMADSFEGYVGIAIGNAKTDISSSALENQLRKLDYTATAQVDDSDTGFKFFGGVYVNPWWGVEAAYVNLGDINAQIALTGWPGGGDLDSQQFIADAANVLPYSVGGMTLSPTGRYALTDRIDITVKLGLFHWRADIKTACVMGCTDSSSKKEKGTDWSGGLGTHYQLDKQFSLGAEWERYTTDRDDIDLFALRIFYLL